MTLYKIVWMEDSAQEFFVWTLNKEDVEIHLENHLGYLPSWWSATKVDPVEGKIFN